MLTELATNLREVDCAAIPTLDLEVLTTLFRSYAERGYLRHRKPELRIV